MTAFMEKLEHLLQHVVLDDVEQAIQQSPQSILILVGLGLRILFGEHSNKCLADAIQLIAEVMDPFRCSVSPNFRLLANRAAVHDFEHQLFAPIFVERHRGVRSSLDQRRKDVITLFVRFGVPL